MNRRAFFHPRYLAQAAGQAQGLLDALTPPLPPPPVDAALVRYGRRAMATDFEIVLPFGTPRAGPAAEDALDLIDRLEDQLTVYRDHSEMCRINRLAFREAVPVEAGLFELLAQAAQLTLDTAGAFDITAGALIKTWGFFRGPRRVPTDSERLQALAQVGMRHVALDATAQSIRFLREGLEINLGSIGKGYALDRAANLLQSEWQMSCALLHGGHSSMVGIGAQPGDDRGWPVGISHPWQTGRRLAIVWLRDRALGTSAATHRHLEWQGKKLGHILDPRTGWPAEGIASASVIAPTAAEADALATAFYILGVEKAEAYCTAHPGIGAVLLPEGTTGRPVIMGLGPDECELEAL